VTESRALSVRPMAPTTGDLRLLQRAFAENGSRKDPEVLAWQYLDRPVAGTFVEFAVDGGAEAESVVGIHAVVPARMWIRGEPRTAGQTLDILTDARFRRQGLFVRLGTSLTARCAADGLAFLYAFPNDSSGPGFFTRLDWRRLDPLPFLVRPLRTRYFAARVPRLGRWLRALPDLPLPRPRAVRDPRVEPLAEFGAELDALWERFAAGVAVAVHRDGAFLRWRYGCKPGERYEVRVLREGGEVRALVVWTVKEKHGGRIGYLMELLHDPARPEDGRLLLAHAVRAMAEEGADAVLAWCLEHSPNRGAFRAGGFVPLPDALRPIRLHFGVRALDPALAGTVEDRRGWYLSYSDSDTV
jgi:hypothetical protein